MKYHAYICISPGDYNLEEINRISNLRILKVKFVILKEHYDRWERKCNISQDAKKINVLFYF